MALHFARKGVSDPHKKVVVTLDRIRGERVDSWVTTKKHWLDAVSKDPTLLEGRDVWNTFRGDFLRDFADPVERAKAEIEEVKMKDIELDAYIANFRGLARTVRPEHALRHPHFPERTSFLLGAVLRRSRQVEDVRGLGRRHSKMHLKIRTYACHFIGTAVVKRRGTPSEAS